MTSPAGSIYCPGCGKSYPWREKLANRQVRCSCGTRFLAEPTIALDETALVDESVFADEALLELEPRLDASLSDAWNQAAQESVPVTARTIAPEPASISPANPSMTGQSSRRRKRRSKPPRQFSNWGRYMLVGALLSPVLTLTPFLQYVAWVLSSIIHEAGHTLFAWFVGCPALPAINLAGHAMTAVTEQRVFICYLVWGLLAWAAVEAWRQNTFFWLALGVLLIYPALAFLPTVREVGFLLSGHLGELLVSGIFLWQARTGLFVNDELDRMAYAIVGWYLVFANAWLCFGLAFVPSVLSWYRTSGSYQLTNDYLRVAEDLLHVPLAKVVLPMLLLAILIPPGVLLVAKSTRGAD